MIAPNLARYYAIDDVFLNHFVREDVWIDTHGNFYPWYDMKALHGKNAKHYCLAIEIPFKKCIDCVCIYDLFGCAKCELYRDVN